MRLGDKDLALDPWCWEWGVGADLRTLLSRLHGHDLGTNHQRNLGIRESGKNRPDSELANG